jgi:hypothetical protein
MFFLTSIFYILFLKKLAASYIVDERLRQCHKKPNLKYQIQRYFICQGIGNVPHMCILPRFATAEHRNGTGMTRWRLCAVRYEALASVQGCIG